MTEAREKHWGAALATAGIPAWCYAVAVVCDGLRCGASHAEFMALIGVIPTVPLMAIALAVAALVVGLWPAARFSRSAWFACNGAAALALTFAIVAYVLSSRADATFCNLNL